ncbi:MAG TPA: hypothetical protein VFA68_10940 [Terriglobales bacterium]|nr:hypothetical protein [Terriglobales bacterium]
MRFLTAGTYLIALLLLSAFSIAQDTKPLPASPSQSREDQSKLEQLRNLPIQWLIGPYIPPSGPFTPLTGRERTRVYFVQTYLNVGTYMARAFAAGIDQAQGDPHEWGGGAAGYGRRFASRYGQFVIENTFVAAGNAALGYEPRYDLCRCTGFWPRSKHAVLRNFVTYNNTERELRPQIPLYLGAFGAGAISSTWMPGHPSALRNGAWVALQEAGYGSGINWVSEFAIDILHKFGIKVDRK